jgi:hypothetical protein
MKADHSKRYYRAAILLLFTMLNSQGVLSQTTDSLLSSWALDGAVQFQLIGGLGVYYLGDCGHVGHYRIGADLNYSHSNQSGNGSGYTMYSSTPPPSSSGNSNTSKPEQNSTSYQISLSGLYLQQLAEYEHVFMYCGVGPMVSYSWNTNTSKSQSIQINSAGYVSSYENDYGGTDKTSGIGTLAIIGFRSRLLNHVGLSAEIAVSAVYQWTTQSNSSTYFSNSGLASNTNTTINSDVTHLDGWAASVSTIRVSLIMEL